MPTETDVSRSGKLDWRVARRLDGEEVAWLNIADREMRIGSARVRMGGIGGVWTEPQHRRQGYMRQVMERAVEFMSERQRLIIPTETAIRAEGALPGRPFEDGDMPCILRIYNETNATRTGSVVRRPWTWPAEGFPMGTRFFTRVDLFVVENERGRIVGYCAVDSAHVDRHSGEVTPIRDEVEVAEVGATDARAWDSILAELGRRATRWEVDEIRCCVPADHEFALHCRSYGARTHISTEADGGPMMRIINQDELMGKLEGELSRRVAGRGLSGSMLVETDLGRFGIVVSNRSARVCAELSESDHAIEGRPHSGLKHSGLTQWKLLQLIVGYRTLDDVLSDPRDVAFAPDRTPPWRSGTSVELRELADALFPPQFAYCWHPDWL